MFEAPFEFYSNFAETSTAILSWFEVVHVVCIPQILFLSLF